MWKGPKTPTGAAAALLVAILSGYGVYSMSIGKTIERRRMKKNEEQIQHLLLQRYKREQEALKNQGKQDGAPVNAS